MKRLIPLLMLLLSALACNAPLIRAPATPTPAPLPTQPPAALTALPTPTIPPELAARAVWLAERIERLDGDHLMNYVSALAAIPSRHAHSPGAAQAADLIAGWMATYPGASVSRQPFALSYRGIDTAQTNAIAGFRGSGPDAVVIGAHYDSRSIDPADAASPAPGANDNASGIAGMLGVIEALGEGCGPLNEPPRRTLIGVAFAAEEINKGGSAAFVQQWPEFSAGQSIEGELVAMINLDTIGNGAGQNGESGLRAFAQPPAGNEPDSPGRTLMRLADLLADDYLPGFDLLPQPTVDRPGRWGDHQPFSEAGIPALRLIEVVEELNRNHTGADLPLHLSPGYLERATGLALALTASLACGPAAPGGLRLEGDRLRWEPAEGAAGYVIGLRHADSLAFDAVMRVTTTGVTLPGGMEWVSVAAIDAEGLAGRFSEEIAAGP